jgi:hypothetical protein
MFKTIVGGFGLTEFRFETEEEAVAFAKQQYRDNPNSGIRVSVHEVGTMRTVTFDSGVVPEYVKSSISYAAFLDSTGSTGRKDC